MTLGHGGVSVAAQVLDLSPQTSCPRKEKKRGGGGASATTKSSGVLSQDLGIGLPIKMLRLRSFFILSLSSIICIKDLSRLSLMFGGKNL